MKGRSLSGYQRKRVWINDGAGRFTDVAQVVGATDTYDGRAVALADLSNRGVLDVIVANQRGPLLSTRTPCSPGATGSRSSSRARRATAARSARASSCTGTGRRRCRRSAAAAASARRTSAGCTSASAPRRAVDRVVIRWPSGPAQTIERPAVDTLHRVKEPPMSHATTTPSTSPAPARCLHASGLAGARQPLPAADPHHVHPARGAPLVRHSRGLRADGAGDRVGDRGELVLGRLTYGRWPHPASAYITGISVGILVRSPFLWPYSSAA